MVDAILGEHATRDVAPRLQSIDTVMRAWKGDWKPTRWQALSLIGKGDPGDRCLVASVNDARLGCTVAIKFVRISKAIRLQLG